MLRDFDLFIFLDFITQSNIIICNVCYLKNVYSVLKIML